MADSLEMKIRYEIGQLDDLIVKSGVLHDLVKQKEPDFIEINAIGSILHSFYNGIENIFLLINKNVDDQFIDDSKWHKGLMLSMIVDNGLRHPVINESTMFVLGEYLAFRHFYRHAYGHTLQWTKMKALFENMDKTWKLTKKDILSFLKER